MGRKSAEYSFSRWTILCSLTANGVFTNAKRLVRRALFLDLAEGRVVLGELLDLVLDHLALAGEELRDGPAEIGVRDVVRAVGRHRQVAALQLVRALRAGLDV